ncbi:MAG TPA: hypothetical protein VGJ28_00195 [Micromonosporaceae bacterium]
MSQAAGTTRPSMAADRLPAAAAPIAETSAINLYADDIETLGVTQFPTTFAGAALTDASTVTVYATANDAALMAAIAAVPAGGAHVVVRTVAHSNEQLTAVAEQIGRDGATLRAEQVNVSSVVVDPAAGVLRVTLAQPADLAGTAIATMIDTARARLTSRYGADWISVADTVEPLATTTSSRSSDGSPWTGGDGIIVGDPGGACTLGFTGRGNKSGNDYLMTAGHCGRGTVTDARNGTRIGTVATQYLGNDPDLDTIRANGRARVWYDRDGTTSNYVVKGFTVPANGTAMTVDGDRNPPQHTGNDISDNQVYTYFNDPPYGQVYIGPTVKINTSACVGGDSGGPAYVRIGSSGGINAVGTITGTDGSHCYVYWMKSALSVANLSLVTG